MFSTKTQEVPEEKKVGGWLFVQYTVRKKNVQKVYL